MDGWMGGRLFFLLVFWVGFLLTFLYHPPRHCSRAAASRSGLVGRHRCVVAARRGMLYDEAGGGRDLSSGSIRGDSDIERHGRACLIPCIEVVVCGWFALARGSSFSMFSLSDTGSEGRKCGDVLSQWEYLVLFPVGKVSRDLK